MYPQESCRAAQPEVLGKKSSIDESFQTGRAVLAEALNTIATEGIMSIDKNTDLIWPRRR